jgi:hypothetical protein
MPKINFKCSLGHKVELTDRELSQMQHSQLLDDNDIEEIQETGLIPTEFCPICKKQEGK